VTRKLHFKVSTTERAASLRQLSCLSSWALLSDSHCFISFCNLCYWI